MVSYLTDLCLWKKDLVLLCCTKPTEWFWHCCRDKHVAYGPMNPGCLAPVHEIPGFLYRGNTCSFVSFPLTNAALPAIFTPVKIYPLTTVGQWPILYLFTHFCTVKAKASLQFSPLYIGGQWKGCPLIKIPATWTKVVNFPLILAVVVNALVALAVYVNNLWQWV